MRSIIEERANLTTSDKDTTSLEGRGNRGVTSCSKCIVETGKNYPQEKCNDTSVTSTRDSSVGIQSLEDPMALERSDGGIRNV